MVNGVTIVHYQLGSHQQEQARLEMQAKILVGTINTFAVFALG